MRTPAAMILALVAISPSARADADSLFDYFGARELALGEAMRGNASGGAAISLNPSGLSLTRELVFEGSYGYRPEDNASHAVLSACDSTVPVPGCFYYRYFSATPEVGGVEITRRVHEAGYVASKLIAPKVVLGVTNKYFDYESDLGDQGEDDSGYAVDIGLTFVASSSLQLGLVGYNMFTADDSSQYPRAAGVGLSLRPTPQLGLAVDAVWNLALEEGQSTGRYGGGMEYFLVSGSQQAGYPLRVGVVHDRTVEGTYATAGLGYRTVKVGLDIGARKQVEGGEELLVLGSLRIFSPVPQAR